MDWAKTTTRQKEKHLGFGAHYARCLTVSLNLHSVYRQVPYCIGMDNYNKDDNKIRSHKHQTYSLKKVNALINAFGVTLY